MSEETEVKEAKEVKEVEAAKNQAVVMKMDEQGLIKIETLADELRVCETLVKAKMVPASFDTGQKLFAARQLCRELGLPVMSAIRQVYVINGSPALWGDVPLALVRKSGLLVSIREFTVDKEYKEICLENKNLDSEIFASICEIQRKDQEKRQFFFTRDQAEKAGLVGKPIWKLYYSRLMQLKARGLALKNEFSDVLMGVAMAEYDFDEIPISGVRNVQDATQTKNLNKFFKGDENGDDRKDETAQN